ncbi:MAG: DEAD/DEAH box helicase [Aestuariibacter sp.]|nr:DEAD/DEAH box helicase [Aestuariibacter sp.]|tara:strand:+ start:51494 stop:53479 length:1986 start_codon:yes stop_codon:yes gene_type:complete
MSQIKDQLHAQLDWASTKWGYVALALDGNRELVIKSLDGRLENWLVTGFNTDMEYNPSSVRLVTFDPKSNVVVREYDPMLLKSSTFDKRTLEALDRAADNQSMDYAEIDFCPKCGSHKTIRVNAGRPMKSCSDYFVCSGRELATEKVHPLRVLDAPSQQYFLREGQMLPDTLLQPEKGNKQAASADGTLTFGDVSETDGQSGIGLPLVNDADVIPTSEYKLLKYPFSHFNRVQSTLLANNIHRNDVNLVLGTATSSGKTVSAELCMARTLAKGDKVVYVSPLRALTQEKYEEWSETFGDDYDIGIMTGDHQLTEARAREVNNSDILCVTSEMLDSRTRKYGSEKSAWIDDIRLVVVDESHIIGTSRGHAVEAGLMRFTNLNSKARILFMSATMPNVEDFAKWLTVLNGKKTEVINSPWRPTPLTWHFPQYIEQGDYRRNQQAKIQEAVNAVMAPEREHEKCLLFVHDKTTGKELVRQLRGEGVVTEFHNADAPKDTRKRIESEFKDPMGKIRVLVATSTLAWGVNVPAKNAIIVGTTRGINQVDLADIHQMAGRAGRALPPEYYIQTPDAEVYTQTSFDRLSIRLLSTDEKSLGQAQVIDIRTDDYTESTPTESKTEKPAATRRKRRQRREIDIDVDALVNDLQSQRKSRRGRNRRATATS